MVNRADQFRVKGFGEEYADLLEIVGVDTVPELAQRNPTNLHKTMKEVNEEKNLVRRLPSESQVKGWVDQEKELPRVITYKKLRISLLTPTLLVIGLLTGTGMQLPNYQPPNPFAYENS